MIRLADLEVNKIISVRSTEQDAKDIVLLREKELLDFQGKLANLDIQEKLAEEKYNLEIRKIREQKDQLFVFIKTRIEINKILARGMP